MKLLRTLDSGARPREFESQLYPYWLCDLGQITLPLWVFVSETELFDPSSNPPKSLRGAERGWMQDHCPSQEKPGKGWEGCDDHSQQEAPDEASVPEKQAQQLEQVSVLSPSFTGMAHLPCEGSSHHVVLCVWREQTGSTQLRA